MQDDSLSLWAAGKALNMCCPVELRVKGGGGKLLLRVLDAAFLPCRFQDHPAVVGPHGIRFYAAVALVVGSGLRLGSL